MSPIRLIDENDSMVGVVDTQEAINRAREVGLDLVEVAADSDPPVCRILDYGKFRYDQSKKEKANKQRSKATEIKEVRLGRSMKIDPHDVEIRMKQARKFLLEGYKVQIVQNFRGREMIHRDRGYDRMKGIVEALSDIAKLEMSPRQNGRRMTMLLAPDRGRIEHFKRSQADASAAPDSDLAELPPEVDEAPETTLPDTPETAAEPDAGTGNDAETPVPVETATPEVEAERVREAGS